MRLLVAVAAHYARGPDGAVYTQGIHRRSFWQRYLEVFDEVTVLARTGRRDDMDSTWVPADGPNIEFRSLPDYAGPWEYLALRSELKAVAREAVADADAYLLRSGGNAVTALAWSEIRRRRRPYAVEVTGDPWGILRPGSVKTCVRPIGRRIYTRNLRLQCRHASAIAYVTRATLQQHYPAALGAFTTHYSTVDMPAEAYVDQPRRFHVPGRRLVYIGNLHHYIKGADVFVEAVASCLRRGVQVQAEMLGGGPRRAEFEQLIRSLGAGDHVRLLGQVTDRRDVIRRLDSADLFVCPSRAEGLPQAMIEAMGRALPCIGTSVGGIPELLPSQDMVPPRDARALSSKIIEVARDPERMTRMSARNLEVASEYRAEVLVPRRREFYQRLRALSGG